MSLPTHSFGTVAHIGTWPDAPAGRTPRRGASYEGIGLSVSVHPDAWQHIARLGGYPLRWMTRRDGRAGLFIDGHAAYPAAKAWARSQGWVAERAGWEVCWEDDELERRVCINTFDADDAAESVVDEPPRAIKITLPTGELLRRLDDYYGAQTNNVHPAFDGELVNRWVATQHPEADGVWWDNILDPATLTAPAGLIVPERLSGWHVRS